MPRLPCDRFTHFPARCSPRQELCRPLPLVEPRPPRLDPYLEAWAPLGEGALGQRAALRRPLLTSAVGGAAIEVLVQPHPGPPRDAPRALRQHARGWRGRHQACALWPPTRCWGARPLETPHRSLAWPGDASARCGTRQRRASRAPWQTVLRCVPQVLPCAHHREGGALTAPMPRPARVWPPLARPGRLGGTGSRGPGRCLALGPGEALVQVAPLRCTHGDVCLQGRVAWPQARVWCPPGVGLPRAPERVLLRQPHSLWGKGRGALAVDRCTRRGGEGWWLRTCHALCSTSCFWKVPFF